MMMTNNSEIIIPMMRAEDVEDELSPSLSFLSPSFWLSLWLDDNEKEDEDEDAVGCGIGVVEEEEEENTIGTDESEDECDEILLEEEEPEESLVHCAVIVVSFAGILSGLGSHSSNV